MIKQKGEYEKLKNFMSNMYHPYVVQEKIDEIGAQNDTSQLSNEDNDVGYKQACCSPQYSRATFVGCSLAIFQQLTGINFIMFYSNTIFASLGSISPTMITFYVGLVNFFATFGGLFLLFKAGRRTIMLNLNALMAVILVMVGICSLK
jgi:hypothetical protein